MINTVTVTPDLAARAPTVEVAALTADPDLISDIAAAEWYVGADPGEGNGTLLYAADGVFDTPNEALAATIDYGIWDFGTHTIYVRAQDSAGNWSVPVSADVQVLNAIYLPLVIRNQ